MNYRQAAEWLEALANPERSGLGRRYARRVNLEATRRMLALLDAPHAGLRVVHIAGTKGKGSVSAMVESVLRTAGHSTGLFTSPHIVSWRERIRINGEPISEDDVARLATEVRPVVEQVEAEGLRRPSFFEACTAMALLAFAEAGLDLCVVEVGLGGRLDATNVLTPLVSVITTLGIDHTRVLGRTLQQIAAEKAGIIKPGVPVVVAPQEPEAAAVVARVAQHQRAPLRPARPFVVAPARRVDPDELQPNRLPPIGERMRGTFAGRELTPLVPLLGAHQAINAGVAAEVCWVLRERGFAVRPEDFARGLERVRWPGRVDLIGIHPWLIADCAHTGESARALMSALRRHLSYERLIVVLGLSKDKAAGEVARELADADLAILTQASLPRAMPAKRLAERTRDCWRRFEVLADPGDALLRAQSLAGRRDAICITGSIFILDDLIERGLLTIPGVSV